jgi:hypothetical protein
LQANNLARELHKSFKKPDAAGKLVIGFVEDRDAISRKFQCVGPGIDAMYGLCGFRFVHARFRYPLLVISGLHLFSLDQLLCEIDNPVGHFAIRAYLVQDGIHFWMPINLTVTTVVSDDLNDRK